MKVPFLELAPAYVELKAAIDAAIQRVLSKGWYILGEEVAAFEREFADYVGAGHCVGVGNGLEAITDSDAMPSTHVVGKFALEGGNFLSEDIPALREHALDRRIDCSLQLNVRRRELEKRDLHWLPPEVRRRNSFQSRT